MRRLLARDPGACPGCGAGLEHGTVWCGGCGARIDAVVSDDRPRTDPPAHTRQGGELATDSTGDGPTRRRVLAGGVAVAVAALVAAAVLRPAPPRPLLGQVGTDTGVTATAAPPAGLRVAWEQALPASSDPFGGPSSSFGPSVVVADGDRVRVDGTVVDAGSGRVVATSSWLRGDDARLSAVVRDGSLVTVDTLTGQVVDRAATSFEVPGDGDMTASLVVDRVALFSSGGTTTLLRLDGSSVATVEGQRFSFLDPVGPSPAAVPLRREDLAGDGPDQSGPGGAFFGGSERDLATLPIRLVAPTTGEEVFATGDDARIRVAQVHGDVAIVAETGGVLGEPGPTGASWQVLVLDARTGELRQRVSTSSAEPPRLVGVTDDDTVVLASRTGSEVRLATVSAQGDVAEIGTVRAAAEVGFDEPFANRAGRVAAVHGDLLIVLRDGEAVASDLDGTVRWRAAGGAEELVAGDGFVALVGASSTRLVRAGDGDIVATVPRWEGLVGPSRQALGIVDGHVGFASGDPVLHAGELRGSTWLDLTDGEETPWEQLFAPFAGEESNESLLPWRFHGTTPGEENRPAQPVVTVAESRASLQVLDVGEGLRRIQLPTPDPTTPVGDLGELAGVAPGRLAVTQYDFEAEVPDVVTHVVDVDEGTVRSLDGWAGLLLTDGTLLAVERIDGSGAGAPTLAAFDPATGDRLWTSSDVDLFGWRRHDGTELVTAERLEVSTFSLDDGTRSWTHDTSSLLADLSPVLGPDRVLVATVAGAVVALDRADGGELWRVEIGAPITSLAGAGPDTVVGTRDGLVVHLDADGRERQRIAVATGPVLGVATLGATTVAMTEQAVVGLRADGDGLGTDDAVELP